MDESTAITDEQIELIEQSWEKVVAISEEAACIFYARLFEVAPALRSLFRGNMTEQGTKLMQMIGTAVYGLRSLDRVVPALQQLGQRHADYGVKESHYQIVGESLLWTLQKGLGSAFTKDTEEAWRVAFGILSKTMIEATQEPV